MLINKIDDIDNCGSLVLYSVDVLFIVLYTKIKNCTKLVILVQFLTLYNICKIDFFLKIQNVFEWWYDNDVISVLVVNENINRESESEREECT